MVLLLLFFTCTDFGDDHDGAQLCLPWGNRGSLGQAVFGKPLWELYIDDWEKSTDGFFKFCLQHGNSRGPLVNLVSDHFPCCFTLLLNFQKLDKFHDADWDVALV